jgi:hypothetical protein
MSTKTFRPRKYQKPRLDRAAAIYSGFLMGGLTLAIVNGEIDIQPADRVTDMARRFVEQHKAILIKHLEGLPK